MSSSISAKKLAAALTEIVASLPEGEVPVAWIDSALEELRTELFDESIVRSDVEIGLSSEFDLSAFVEDTRLSGSGAARNLSELPSLVGWRYSVESKLGSGGQGIVKQVRDKCLQRSVALKSLRAKLRDKAAAVDSFLREPRITGQLGHAGIVPIHDIGLLSDGSPCYTMGVIKGRSLRDILVKLRHYLKQGQKEPAAGPGREFSRSRLLEVMVSVSHTLGYAHHMGVVHRDIKPANIMVGAFGEVKVLDWGVAIVLSEPGDEPEAYEISVETHAEATRTGIVKGTPGYMAPEQASGDRGVQGPGCDVYALGLILFEVLAGCPVRRPGSVEEALKLAREANIESPELVRRKEAPGLDPIPEELEQICLKCLEKDPSDRYPDAEALALALEAYRDGERRRELAVAKAREGDALVEELKGLEAESGRRREEARLLSDAIEPWADIGRRRLIWAKEDLVKATELKSDQTLVEAFALYTQALGYDPENARARSGMARLYFEMLKSAEKWGRWKDARLYEAQARRLDTGALSEVLRGDGGLVMTSDPIGAQVSLFRYQEIDRILVPCGEQLLGCTPVSTRLEMGRYLVCVRFEGGEGESLILYPIQITRQGHWEGHVKRYPTMPAGFVRVPAGLFWMGGDRLASGALPRSQRWVDDFAIAVYPVTCGEYLEFLNSIAIRDGQKGESRAPRTKGAAGGEVLWPRGEDGAFRIPRVDVNGGRWSTDTPVRCVSMEDAEAYCVWLSDLRNLPFRLPTEEEWEKAGRGVDGRWFPWGDSFDATFCKMKDSRAGAPEPEPVGSFPTDTSPYGVRDLAGGVIEWCSGPFDRHGLLGIQKGGFWMASEANCRLSRRFGVFPGEPEQFGGFRLAFSPGRLI